MHFFFLFDWGKNTEPVTGRRFFLVALISWLICGSLRSYQKREEVVLLRSSGTYRGWRITVMVFGVSICLAGRVGHCTNATGLEYIRRMSGLCARRDISKIGDE